MIIKRRLPENGNNVTSLSTFDGLMEVGMLLPGDNAKKHRAQASDLIKRHLAGDPTLHKDINKNAASDASINSLARESMDLPHPHSIMEIDKRTSGLKRLREEGGNQESMMQDMPMLMHMEQMVGCMTQTCTKASETKVHVQDIAKIQAEARNQLFVDKQKLGEQEFLQLTRKGDLEIQQLNAKNDLEINHLTKMAKIRTDEATHLADEEKRLTGEKKKQADEEQRLIAARQVPRTWRIRQPDNGALFEPM
jgi:hypothetical protein